MSVIFAANDWYFVLTDLYA